MYFCHWLDWGILRCFHFPMKRKEQQFKTGFLFLPVFGTFDPFHTQMQEYFSQCLFYCVVGAVSSHLTLVYGFYIIQKLGVENQTKCLRNFQWSYIGGGSLSISYTGCCSISLNVGRKKQHASKVGMGECWKN